MTTTWLGRQRPVLRSRAERDRLVEQFLPLVHHIVGRLTLSLPQGVERDDLYSVGVLGLIHAAETYDEQKGAAFKTYAYTTVRGAILDELRRLDPVPRSARERIRRLEQASRDLTARLGRAATREELAEHLECSLAEVDEAFVAMHTANVLSLDDAGDDTDTRGDQLPARGSRDPSEIVERREAIELVTRAIGDLPEQASQTLILYYHEGLLLKEIGTILGVSESRVSQILSKATTRLRLALEGSAWISA